MKHKDDLNEQLQTIIRLYIRPEFHRIAKHKLAELAEKYGPERVNKRFDFLAKKKVRRMDYWV